MFLQLFEKKDDRPFIPIVSGLPRSGTSLMMSMLAAGGLDVMTDQLRIADDDNPVGYFELEDVKKLIKGEHAWLASSNGKAVKVISTLLPYLPDGYHYRIIFMRRAIEEVLASQRKMLINRGEDPDNSQSHAARIEINYKELIANPGPLVAEINRFLGGGLDEGKMLSVIDPALYRHRSQK
jgi:hypothetical protein